jgi:hypothetical protein
VNDKGLQFLGAFGCNEYSVTIYRLLVRGLPLKCSRCGRGFRVGERVIRVDTSGIHDYHSGCLPSEFRWGSRYRLSSLLRAWRRTEVEPCGVGHQSALAPAASALEGAEPSRGASLLPDNGSDT